MRRFRSVVCSAVLIFSCGSSPVARAAEPPAHVDFEKGVRPLLEHYCFDCHGPGKSKGDVTLAPFTDSASVIREPKLWTTVLKQVREREMPPRSKPQPNADERERLEAGLRGVLSEIDPEKLAKEPGRAVIRRLNRTEYNNTIRDLLGVDCHPADAFPTDGSGGGGFDNNADTLFVPPILMEQFLRAAGIVLQQVPADRLFTAKPSPELPKREAAKRIIEAFLPKAFRRPTRAGEVDRYLTLFDFADKRGDSFEDATRLALRGVLVSPNFLFRVEHEEPGAKEAYAVNDFELASRLSYFIWASMPDETLFKLAADGKLHEPPVLEEQARRMLKDPRSKALAEGFGTQWLEVRTLRTVVEPDRGKFPQYTDSLCEAMIEETVLLVDSVFRDDVSVMKLIDADYTFLNEELAKHYGIPNVTGNEMRRVTLNDKNRGGVLGLGAVLTATSYPRRTSPVLRGKWVLADLLGAPPPPPPPEVVRLEEDDKKADAKATLRQRLEKHRADASCASCHNRLDPLGFGLENFDTIGRWRDNDEGNPIDSSGVLTTGEQFKGPAELKIVLATSRRPQFLRNLAEKMLSYALGRGTEYYDEAAIRSLVESLEKSDCRSGVLVAEIVKSYPFRFKRNGE